MRGSAAEAEIIQDLVSQGFSCDEAAACCTRAVMDGACADAWTVDFSGNGEASWALVRRCIGAGADDE